MAADPNAQLFFLPQPVVFTANGGAASGARIYFYEHDTLTPVAVYTTDELNVAHTNPVIANGAGRIPDIYFDNSIDYRVIVKDRLGNTLSNVDPYTVEAALFPSLLTLASGAAVSTRGALAAIAAAGAGHQASLTESGREGTFVWSASDLSSLVAADIAQGIYVGPASDATGASGAWVRRFFGPVEAAWFGISTAASGAANATARDAMFAVLRLRSPSVGYQQQALERVVFPGGDLPFATTFEVTEGTHDVRGAVRAQGDSGTTFVTPAGVTALRVQTATTEGASGTRAAGKTGHYSRFEDIVFQGDWAPGEAEAEAHAIDLRGRAEFHNCWFNNFHSANKLFF